MRRQDKHGSRQQKTRKRRRVFMTITVCAACTMLLAAGGGVLLYVLDPFPLEIPAFTDENGEMYMHLDSLANMYPFRVQYIPETNIVWIEKDGDVRQPMHVKAEASEHERRLRQEADMRSPYTQEMEAGKTVYRQEETDDFYYVRLENGEGGFIPKKAVTPLDSETVEVEWEPSERTQFDVPKPINLVWEAIYTATPDPDNLPDMPGVNVVSPTWFSLASNDGEVANLGSEAYMEWARKHDFHVWALFSNDFDPDMTHEALRNYETRQRIIRQLLQYSEMYGLDGLNIDIENVYLEDRDYITQFMRELTPLAHQMGLVISMDVTFISTSEMWSRIYDREALAEIVDYMIVMAYDEHWATSPVAGSVASLPWVERNIERMLEIVPAEKLVLGIPFYTRIWEEVTEADGTRQVSSRAVGMETVVQWLADNDVRAELDETTQQYYAEYTERTQTVSSEKEQPGSDNEQSDNGNEQVDNDNDQPGSDNEQSENGNEQANNGNEQAEVRHRVWKENAHSLRERVALVHNYDLAGVAGWARSFADDQTWDVLTEELFGDEDE